MSEWERVGSPAAPFMRKRARRERGGEGRGMMIRMIPTYSTRTNWSRNGTCTASAAGPPTHGFNSREKAYTV